MIYKSLINRLKIIYKHDYENVAKMQGKRKFYDIEDDQNPLINKIPLRKQSVIKNINRSNRIKISIFIHIQGEGKAISETAKENTEIR